MLILGWTLLIAGGWACLLNLYLSFLRYPLHRARGRSPESFRWVSGFPLIGSMAVVLAWTIWIRHQDSPRLDVAVWLIAILDTGGIHWLVGVLISQRIRGQG
ncbi:MAG TPA: hypothetical protein PKA37_09625 [Planctomycetota bacterium]|nr:hypothetical protein [Planctomycetota bacterium]